MADALNFGGFYDTPIWTKGVNENGDQIKVMCLPITRYDNIVGRPKLVDDVADMMPSPIALLRVREEDIDENIIFNIAGQTW